MRWLTLVSLVVSISFSFCAPEDRPDNTSKIYFDLKGFFAKQTANLQQKNPVIRKSIGKNDLEETRNIAIRNWANELELFSASDINKSSWKDMYDVRSTGSITRYTAKNDDLRTREIVVDKSPEGIVKHIFILNQTANNLYSSIEELNYFPDSLYSIRKKQDILLIGHNDYLITGDLKAGSN